jgi:multicomponent Na+:H+ antiporter subunit D
MNKLLPLFVIIPLGMAFLIPIIRKLFPTLYNLITPSGLLFLAGLSIYYMLTLHGSTVVYKVGGWESIAGIPIGIHLVLDGFSVLMLFIINFIGCLVAIYSISYISKYTAEYYYFTLFNLMIAGMSGVVITGDLFNLFVFLEISVIASYSLVAFGTGKEELEASFKYQVLGGIASLFILFGIGMIYWCTKSLNMSDIGEIFKTGTSQPVILFIQLFLIAGFGLKAAMVPFHSWLPDAHSSAPSPISAMLSGVLIKAIGIYALLRLFFNMFEIRYEISVIITAIGVLSMVVGVFLAIGQWDLKRLLAYHSISQMGYVVMAAGIGMIILSRSGNTAIAALSVFGALFHLLNHAVFKGLLFLNAGAIEYSTGKRNLTEMGGLSEQMPVTSATSFGASMAISGIPPFNGFFSKLVIIIAAVKAEFYGLALLAVVVSIITLASFLKFQRYAFNGAKKSDREVLEVPLPMRFTMITLALFCILLSLLIFPEIRDIVLSPAVNALFANKPL